MDIEKDLLKVVLKVDYKIVNETLNRIGVANKKEHILYPSCYLFNLNGTYYLVHFKQMFALTRNDAYNNISKEDISRRNGIAYCLQNWNLITVDENDIEERGKFVFVLPYHEKQNWIIEHKFNVNILNNHQAEIHAGNR
jgi:hypothetical protein